jgi:hypothetical protein
MCEDRSLMYLDPGHTIRSSDQNENYTELQPWRYACLYRCATNVMNGPLQTIQVCVERTRTTSREGENMLCYSK